MEQGLLSNRNQVMTLYAGDRCAYSHRTRLVLAEKDISVDINILYTEQAPEEISELNPDGDLPVLVDRDIVLYRSFIIMEYLDERFPHPPLMPIDPVSRAQARLLLHRVDMDWYRPLVAIDEASGKRAVDRRRKALINSLTALVPLFRGQYLVGDALSLVDCAVLPVLWRLPHYDIQLPKAAQPLLDYAKRMFARPGFRASLSDSEREMRGA